jgi:hypothetical protein
MEQTSIEVAGIQILEPVTVLTDLLVSTICLFAFYKLKVEKYEEKLRPSVKLYKYFFLTMSLSTAYGGIIGHGFLYIFGFAWKIPGWIIAMISVALAERGAIMHARPYLRSSLGTFFSVLNIIELLIFIILAMSFLNFIYVEIHAVYGLLVVLFSFELFVFIKTHDQGSKLLLWSVFFAVFAAISHLTKYTIHKWFNYLDLSHVFMSISSFVLYKGVEKMGDRKTNVQ